MAPGFLFFPVFFLSVYAQNISTAATIPPLQWINLSNLLQGSSRPPPLKNVAMGYDETSRSLIIFGGLSESGFPQSQTFLLNLQTLSWSVPSPPSTLQRSPPSRSAVVSGGDFAASNRQGFVVIGGKGSDGKALSDVWEYDFNNQFWSEVNLLPGGPSPRWGASGGIDTRVAPVPDSVVPGPNNTFYLAGGYDGTTVSPLSDVWRLKIAGTLSSNLPDSVVGSWDRISIGNLPGRVDQAGTVLSQQIISSGGCTSTDSLYAMNASCATQNSYIVDLQRQLAMSPGFCPTPRIGSVMIPNLNAFSSAFGSQAFLLLGITNTTLWNDSNGLTQGEVAILDTATGTWTRVLPAGDPDSSGKLHFPSPREGAAAISFPQSLVGDARSTSSDTIVFGGQDVKGSFLSDVWLLRSYAGATNPSSPTWSGFGNGRLQSGVNADGSGVRVKYLTDCASFIPPPSRPATSPDPGSTPFPPGSSPLIQARPYNTSSSHKILGAVSLATLLPVILFLRWFSTSFEGGWLPKRRVLLLVMAIGCVAYGLGIVGFVLGFTSISSTSLASKRHLKTAHGTVSLVFFICTYVLVPLLYLVIFIVPQRTRDDSGIQSPSQTNDTGRPDSIITLEKVDTAMSAGRSVTPSIHNTSPPSSPRNRTLSWDASNMFRPNTPEGVSTESSPVGTSRGFEVMNRPGRTRKLSAPCPQSVPSDETIRRRHATTRSLGDIDWLLRRRSLNTVGELDYVLTQAHNAQVASLNAKEGIELPDSLQADVQYPSRHLSALHIFTHISILGLSAITLSALWLRVSRHYFAVFLPWIALFYAASLLLAWNGRPNTSILTATLWRLRGNTTHHPIPNSANAPPVTGNNPYTHHRPSHRPSTLHDGLSHSHGRPLSVETDDIEEDLDEETRQRVIEEEMARRDVSIVTVPRRKLQIANPS